MADAAVKVESRPLGDMHHGPAARTVRAVEIVEARHSTCDLDVQSVHDESSFAAAAGMGRRCRLWRGNDARMKLSCRSWAAVAVFGQASPARAQRSGASIGAQLVRPDNRQSCNFSL